MHKEMASPGRFEDWWQHRGEWVEAPNLRRGGESGVKRVHAANGQVLYVKRQVQHLYRSLRHPRGRPTVLRERDALHAFSALGIRVPELRYCDAEQGTGRQWRALLVTAELEGFMDLERWYASGGHERHGEQLHRRLLIQVGVVLARLHRQRWQHGCLYSKHIFVRLQGSDETGTVEVALLDLEKSRQRFTAWQAARHDFRQLKRHSSWNDLQWQALIYGYQTAYGSVPTGLTR